MSRFMDEVKRRYQRDVIAGKLIVHYGDCYFYAADVNICTCGLFHFCLGYDYKIEDKSLFYDNFDDDFAKHMGKLDELNLGIHDE